MVVISTSERKRTVNRGFTGFMVGSLLLHGAAFGAVIAVQNRGPRDPDLQQAIPVELVRLGKPRDPELLPRKQTRAPPPKDEGVNLDTGKKPKKKPPPRKKRRTEDKMSAAARALLSGSNDSSLDDALSKLEAPEGAPDGSPMGTTSDPTHAAQGYAAAIGASLQQAYRLPETIPASQRRFLNAEVQLFIEGNGRISRYEIVKRHPNELFMRALERMLKSHQLPPPPAALARRYQQKGVVVRFKP